MEVISIKKHKVLNFAADEQFSYYLEKASEQYITFPQIFESS